MASATFPAREKAGGTIYNVPLTLFDRYRSHRLIVRTDDPERLTRCLPEPDSNDLACIQLLALPDAVEPLLHWGETIPIDIVLTDPAAFPRLYGYSKLIDTHPVRVTLPVTAQTEKAAKLASALPFAVKLSVHQPDSAQLETLAHLLDYYLHHSTVSQPIDYFHGLLFAFRERMPIDLWAIQEEDPASFRYITEAGEETLNGRFMGAGTGRGLDDFLPRYRQTLRDQHAECNDCPYFLHCGGYFKWPDPTYRCEGVKTLFSILRDAAEELERDLAHFDSSQREQP